MLRCRKGDMHKWAPLGPLRFADKMHVRFLRQPIAFACIARDARANHIFPCSRSASFTRHDMIKIQVVALEDLAAVLAGVLVALENVVASELHFLFREPIEKEQHDYARHPNLPRNCRDDFVIGRGGGEVAPTVEVMDEEIVFVVGGNNVSVARVNERERAPRRADVDRLPETVQHQYLTI